MLSVGQVLNLPGGTSGGTYTVQSGDTMTSIAAQFGITLAALEAANPQISNPDMLSVGQVLNLPGGSTNGPGNGVQPISVQDVDFTLYSGAGDINIWISQACQRPAYQLTLIG